MQSLGIQICGYDTQGWSATARRAVAPTRSSDMMAVVFHPSAAKNVDSVASLRAWSHDDEGLVLVADVAGGVCKETLVRVLSNILVAFSQSTHSSLRISPEGILPSDSDDRRELPRLLFESLATVVGKMSTADADELKTRSIELCLGDTKEANRYTEQLVTWENRRRRARTLRSAPATQQPSSTVSLPSPRWIALCSSTTTQESEGKPTIETCWKRCVGKGVPGLVALGERVGGRLWYDRKLVRAKVVAAEDNEESTDNAQDGKTPYTYVSLDVGPILFEKGEQLWVTETSLHVTLAYIPPMSEMAARDMQADLNDMIGQYYTLAPGDRMGELFKVRKFYEVQKGSKTGWFDTKVNIAAHKWEKIEEKWRYGDWYWASRNVPDTSDLTQMRSTWQAAAGAYADRVRTAERLIDAERRIARGPIHGARDTGAIATDINSGLDALTFTADDTSEIFDLAAYLIQLLHTKQVRNWKDFQRHWHKIMKVSKLHLTWKQETRAWGVPRSGQPSQRLDVCKDVEHNRVLLRGGSNTRTSLQRGSIDEPGDAVAADCSTGGIDGALVRVPLTSPFDATADYNAREEFKAGYLTLSEGDRVHVYLGTDAAAELGDRFPDRWYVFAARPDQATNAAEGSRGWVPRDVLCSASPVG